MGKTALILALVWIGVSGASAQSGDGFRYPAEWEDHTTVWMGMRTHETEALRASGHRHHHDLVTVPMLKALTPHIPVKLIVEDRTMVAVVTELLEQSEIDPSRVSFVTQSPTHIWYRDIGPIFLTDGRSLRVADFAFSNYANVDPDEHTAEAQQLGRADRDVAQRLSLETVGSRLVMEGGSITVNGKGTVIVSKLTQRRNPHLSVAEIETELKRVLGQKKVIWLNEGTIEDQQEWKKIGGNYWGAGTGGHTDEFVSFLDPKTVALHWVDESERYANPVNTINYERMLENYRILESATDQDDQPLNIVKLPLPDLQFEEIRLPASNIPAFRVSDPTIRAGDTIRWVAVSSYMNYVITNDVILLPAFWKPGASDSQRLKDQRVFDIFQSTYPDRQIIQINPLVLNHLGGGMHCLVQTQPRLLD